MVCVGVLAVLVEVPMAVEVRVGCIGGVRLGVKVDGRVGVPVGDRSGVGLGVIVLPVTVKKAVETTPQSKLLLLPCTTRICRPFVKLPVSTVAQTFATPPPKLPPIATPQPSQGRRSTA